MDSVRRGIKEFLLKYSAPSSLSPKAPPLDSYTTIISVHKGSNGEKYVKQFLEERGWHGKYIIVTNEDNEHLNAMCSSDMGMVYDGQMVSSAAACHLPIMILYNMRMHHQWYHDLFNRWWNSMNIIADNNLYPEVVGGEVWFGKICDTLAEWYLKPEIRYDLIRKWEYFLKDAMSYRRINRQEVKSRNIILADGLTYDEFKDPFKQVARHLWRDIENYELRSGPCPNFQELNAHIPKLQ